VIQTRLGHSSITFTIHRYSHLFPSVEQALAEKLDAIYNERPGDGDHQRHALRTEGAED
jgi:hypothetical protein